MTILTGVTTVGVVPGDGTVGAGILGVGMVITEDTTDSITHTGLGEDITDITHLGVTDMVFTDHLDTDMLTALITTTDITDTINMLTTIAEEHLLTEIP